MFAKVCLAIMQNMRMHTLGPITSCSVTRHLPPARSQQSPFSTSSITCFRSILQRNQLDHNSKKIVPGGRASMHVVQCAGVAPSMLAAQRPCSFGLAVLVANNAKGKGYERAL